MNAAPGGPASLRLARWMSGEGEPGAEPAPPPGWTAEGGSPAARAVAAAVAVVARAVSSSPARVAARIADAGARPVLLASGALLAAPVLRILLPAPWGTAAAASVAAAAALAAVLAMASALHEGEKRRLVLGALLAGFALRLLFAGVLRVVGAFPDEYGYYDALARDAAGCWAAGGPSLLPTHPVVESRAAYFYLLSGAYTLVGPSMMAGRVLGALVGTLGALAAGEVARPLAGARAAAIAVALLALHPEHAFWSATLSRDALTVLLSLAALALLLRRGILPALVPLGLLALNAFLVAGALAAALVAVAVARAVARGGAGPARAARLVAALLAAAAALAVVGNAYGHFFTPEMVARVRTSAIGTVPDFLPDLELRTVGGVLALLPAGVAFVLGAPFPWDATHLHRFAYGFLALGGLAATLLGLAGAAALFRRRLSPAAPVLLFAATLLVLLALLEATSGIVVRHRLPFTAVLAVAGACLLAGFRGAPAR